MVAACGPLPDVDWPLNGELDNIRYSPLSEITRDNVADAIALILEDRRLLSIPEAGKR